MAVVAAAAAFTVSPERVRIAAGSRAALTIRASGPVGASVTLGTTGYRLDLRGRPVLGGHRVRWLAVFPRALVLRRGGSAVVNVLTRRPTQPGDHVAAVVVTFRPSGAGTTTAVRVGAVVVVRTQGALRRVVVIRSLAYAAGRLRLVIANAGNVVETLRLVVRLVRRGVAAVFRARRRLLPGSRALLEWRVPPRLHGSFTASVTIGGVRAGRTFPLRL
ncbi:MAG TPA: hypothetical protein VI408_05110 [Gaiellaceae bacterium]